MLYNSELKEGDKVWWYTFNIHDIKYNHIHSGLVTRLIYEDEDDEYPFILTTEPYNHSQEFYSTKKDAMKALKNYQKYIKLHTCSKGD